MIFFIVLMPRSFSSKEVEKVSDYLFKSLETIDLKLLIFFNTTDEWKFHFFNVSNIAEIDFLKLKVDMKNLIESYYDENFKPKKPDLNELNKHLDLEIDNLIL